MERHGVLFLIDHLYGPAGAERNVIQVASNIDHRRFNPVICCLTAGEFIEELRRKGLKVINLNIKRIYGIGALSKLFFLRRLVRRENIKIIVSYHDASDYYGLLVGKVCGVPIIISNRRDMGFKLTPRHILLYRIFNRFYSRIITVCDALKKKMAETEGADPGKVVTIYNSVPDNSVFDYDGFTTKRELNLDPNKRVVAKIGNLRAIKGHRYLLEAAALVKQEYPDVQFLIVGYDLKEEGSSISYLSEFAAKLGISNDILFAGYRKDIRNVLESVDVSVSASLSEGCSNVILESMRCSKPVVATAVGGTPELIQNGVNGCLVPPRDPTAMAQALLKILRDPSLAEKLGRSGCQSFSEKFTEAKMMDRLHRLFESLLRAKGVRMLPAAKRREHAEEHSLASEANSVDEDQWPLCPLLSASEILTVLRRKARELLSCGRLATSEQILNIYFLVSALHQIVGDYLIRGFYNFSKLSKDIPVLRPAIDLWHRLNERLIRARNTLLERRLQRYLLGVEGIQSQLADHLVRPYDANEHRRLAESTLRRIEGLGDAPLSLSLLEKRLKLPAAFRSFALTHIDMLRLGDKFMGAHPEKLPSITVLGLRATGSYLAPLLSRCLRSSLRCKVDFLTLRPKSGASSFEHNRLKALSRTNARIVLIDDPPTTGGTFKLSVERLLGYGYGKQRISILIPEFPYVNEWASASSREPLRSVEVLKLPYEEWFVNDLLAPERVKQALMPYFERRGVTSIEVSDSTPYTIAVNQAFSRKNRMGEREKRVYQVTLRDGAAARTMYVLAKSVGWGWFGYHALTAAKSLERFVPRTLGVRDGLLFMEWAANERADQRRTRDEAPSLTKMADYVSARVRGLGLGADPSSDLTDRNIGWAETANILSSVYSRKLGKLKRHTVLRKLVRAFPCPVPTMTDGRLGPEDWVRNERHQFKIDFEEHGFDNSDLSVVDPSYDLASAIYEHRLDEKQESALLDRYRWSSGDRHLAERLFFHKILYGYNKLYESAMKARLLTQPDAKREWDRSYLRALQFLTDTTNSYLAKAVGISECRGAANKIFVLDIDGVLDDYSFVFASSSPLGVLSLKLLQDDGYAIVLNSGRSLEEVRSYCKIFGAIGGIAEYGAVIWDALKGEARVLISEKEIEELGRLKDAFSNLKDVFVSGLHDFSVRAYSYRNVDQVKLPGDMVKEVIERSCVGPLQLVRGVGRTELASTSVDKGTGLQALIDFMGLKPSQIAAMGDSDPDIPMFEHADPCFAPLNHSSAIDALARENKVRVFKGICQRGLFQAAAYITRGDKRGDAEQILRGKLPGGGLGLKLLSIKDKPKWLRLLSLLSVDTLRVFRS